VFLINFQIVTRRNRFFLKTYEEILVGKYGTKAVTTEALELLVAHDL
jgi:hypothetical protein